MITLSLCMIVKNEEAVLARCLSSVKEVMDEIIIVDTGSQDSTVEIARQFTDKVYSFPWVDDFSAARNFSFSKATMQYLFWMDADDILLPQDRENLFSLKETLDPSIDLVMMKYHVAFDGQGNPVFSYYRERMLRRAKQYRWQGAIHEAITPEGNILYSEIALTHRKIGAGDPDRNLRIFEKMIKEGKKLVPRENYYYGRELYYHGQYQQAAYILSRYLDTPGGWIENQITACQDLANCYYHLGNPQQALDSLLRSFSFDTPRAEICCDIGKHFFQQEKYAQAAFWYETAAKRPKEERNGGFIQPDCYGYLPYLQLCLCYYRLGDLSLAKEYNEKAAQCKPADPAVIYNRNFFSSLDLEK